LQASHGLGLATKPSQPVWVDWAVVADHLEGDKPIEAVVPSLVDHAHAAAANQAKDFVTGDRRPDYGWLGRTTPAGYQRFAPGDRFGNRVQGGVDFEVQMELVKKLGKALQVFLDVSSLATRFTEKNLLIQ
jgi:hypothetical protein